MLAGYFKRSCEAATTLFTSLTKTDQLTVYLRSGLPKIPIQAYICGNHLKRILNEFSAFEKFCCDALRKHKDFIKRDLRPVSLLSSVLYNKVLTENEKKVLPGEKMCSNCRKIFGQRIKVLSSLEIVLPPIVFEKPSTLSQESGSTTFETFSVGGKSENPDDVFCTPKEDQLTNFNSALSIQRLSQTSENCI